MPIKIPTTNEIAQRNLTNLETQLGQTAPLSFKAFLRVVANLDALNFTDLYKFIADRIKQNLALTATGSDLDIIGESYGVPRKAATAARYPVRITATGAGTIAVGTVLFNAINGLRYTLENTVVITGPGDVTTDVRCTTLGSVGNLEIGAILTFEGTIDFVNADTVVLSGGADGIDRETDEEYHPRILDEIRTVGGGGNGVDYRRWAEEPPGVKRAYPYAGKPLAWQGDPVSVFFYADGKTIGASSAEFVSDFGFASDKGHYIKITGHPEPANNGTFLVEYAADSGGATPSQIQVAGAPFVVSGVEPVAIENVGLPGDRTVFIEATSAVDPDGIAPQWLLDDARDSINTDPVTAGARPPLGETDETLNVLSIARPAFYVSITGLEVGDGSAEIIDQAKGEIEAALTEYFAVVKPFVDSIDSELDRNDTITTASVSKVVQDVLVSLGGSITGLTVGTSAYIDSSPYQLPQGELAKLGSIQYVP